VVSNSPNFHHPPTLGPSGDIKLTVYNSFTPFTLSFHSGLQLSLSFHSGSAFLCNRRLPWFVFSFRLLLKKSVGFVSFCFPVCLFADFDYPGNARKKKRKKKKKKAWTFTETSKN
jgi:hypothetical protein